VAAAASRFPKVKFAHDSPLEGARFEPSVPVWRAAVFEPASVPSRAVVVGAEVMVRRRSPPRSHRLRSPTAEVRFRASAGSIKLSRRVGPYRPARRDLPTAPELPPARVVVHTRSIIFLPCALFNHSPLSTGGDALIRAP
jgi:hypothetical protein